MHTLLFLLLLLAAFVTTNAEEEVVKDKRNITGTNNEDPLDKLTEDISSHIATPTLGSIAVVVLLGFIIYFLCCRKKAPEEGFTQLDNENGPPRRWRWRGRRFSRRNRRWNNQPNPPAAPHATHVVIQPVVAVAIPSENFHAANAQAVPNMMPPAPPPYDGGMNNQHHFHGGNVRQTMTSPPPQFTKY